MIIWLFFFLKSVIVTVNYTDYFQMLTQTYIPGTNPTWLWYDVLSFKYTVGFDLLKFYL